MNYRFVENKDMTFGRKTSNTSGQDNSTSGILAEVRTLGLVRGSLFLARVFLLVLVIDG